MALVLSWIFHYHEHYHNKLTYNLYWELIECCPSLHSVQSTLSKHVKNVLDRGLSWGMPQEKFETLLY